MTGRYFPGEWELIPYEMPELVSEPEETTPEKIEEETEVSTDDIDAGLGKSLAADEADNQGGKIAAKKSGRRKKANRKEIEMLRKNPYVIILPELWISNCINT